MHSKQSRSKGHPSYIQTYKNTFSDEIKEMQVITLRSGSRLGSWEGAGNKVVEKGRSTAHRTPMCHY